MNYIFLIVVLLAVIAVIGIAAFSNFSLNNIQYDRLKWITIRWSYIVTFLALVVKTFEVPYGVETVAIVAGIGAMMAGLLNISNTAYKTHLDLTSDQDYDEDQLTLMTDILSDEDLKEVQNGSSKS